MTEPARIFHLAIPCRDLDAAEAFYVNGLGCRRARRYEDRVTLEFFAHQVVCHLAPDAVDEDPALYPRHFGITFRSVDDFDRVLRRARDAALPFFRKPFTRFGGRPDEHASFVLRDPSNNLIEFKHYLDPAMMY